MTYRLRAGIAAESMLAARELPLRHAQAVPIGSGLALIPITLDVLQATDGEAADRFLDLTSTLADALSSWSVAAPIAYVEAEYFGGVGEQHAQVWQDGAVTLGPLHLEEGEAFAPAGSPISQVLRRLGVDRADHVDEFDAVDLGRYRSTASWLPPVAP